MNPGTAETILRDRTVTCPECGQFIGVIRGDDYPSPSEDCCAALIEDIRQLRNETKAALREAALAERLRVRS